MSKQSSLLWIHTYYLFVDYWPLLVFAVWAMLGIYWDEISNVNQGRIAVSFIVSSPVLFVLSSASKALK